MESQTTFVCCIEAGPMEQQVIMLARSLRMLDSPLAQTPLIAVQPRPGPRISRQTRRVLADLNVRFIRKNLVTRYAWYQFCNKSATMAWAEQNLTTPYLTWIDSDIIFVRDMPDIIPEKGVSMVGRAGEGSLGTDGKDANVGYWQKLSELSGIDYKAANWVSSLPDGRDIYEYYQGGLFTVLRTEGISQYYASLTLMALDHKIASGDAGIFHHDQACLSMAARTAKGQRVMLPWEANYNFNMLNPETVDRDMLRRVQGLHYHGAFYPEHYGLAEPFLDELPPHIVELIKEYAPLEVHMSPLARLERKIRSEQAKRQMKAHEIQCTVY